MRSLRLRHGPARVSGARPQLRPLQFTRPVFESRDVDPLAGCKQAASLAPVFPSDLLVCRPQVVDVAGLRRLVPTRRVYTGSATSELEVMVEIRAVESVA